ncbi:ankyrin repeat domain-containing protein 66 isoform X2 [Mobula hypostoma]|uniref:ankyrin repeat domain-containing protein 66 isoform X2 n=1 Tax=Mobula hypostoma TaxID=723540 RepID=UPI002FC2E4B2
MSELHEAAAAGDTDLVEQILQKGSCDPSMKDPDWGDRTPLHWAAAKGKADMVKLLITSGSRPCLRTTTGWTPAHFAAESGKLSVLKMLHSLHAPVDKADLYGDTPRRMAEIYGQGDCVKFLKVAEQESSNYRRAAEMKGILLDDTDEEWESQKESKTAEKRETVSKSIITCLDGKVDFKGDIFLDLNESHLHVFTSCEMSQSCCCKMNVSFIYGTMSTK